jgi:DNA-binding CsgD family transcriptional regulator
LSAPIGDVSTARALAEEGAALMRDGDGWWHRTAATVVALNALFAGDADTCRRVLLRGGGGPELSRLQPSMRPRHLESLALTYLELGDTASAHAAARTACALATDLGLPGQLGCAMRAMGVVLAAMGDPAGAATHYVSAADNFASVGLNLDEARTYLAAIPAYLACGRVAEVHTMLDRAMVIAATVGATWLSTAVEGVRASLLTGSCRHLGATAAPAAPAQVITPAIAIAQPDPVSRQALRNDILATLTEREREVAQLVGTGRTSRQIAQLIGVSTRTVETHLAHIYRKLDVPSRSALAGLVGRGMSESMTSADSNVVPLRGLR